MQRQPQRMILLPFTAALLLTRVRNYFAEAVPRQEIVAAHHQLTGTKISTDSKRVHGDGLLYAVSSTAHKTLPC
jgi:hypothetical protein